MKKELLRLKNIQVVHDGISRLKNLNLSIYEGEILGIYGAYDSGKTTLFDVLSGELSIHSGTIFFQEKPCHSQEWVSCIARISEENFLVSSMSVWKSVLALRRTKGRKVLLPSSFLQKEMQQYLDSFGLPINAFQPIYTLNPLQKQMLEILKACLLGKKIILVDSFPADYSDEDYRLFDSFLQKIKAEGTSVLIAASSLLNLRLCTDTISYLWKGSIQKSFCTRQDPDSYFSTLSKSIVPEQELRFSNDNSTNTVLSEKARFVISGSVHPSLTLYKGQIVSVTDPFNTISSNLEKELFCFSPKAKHGLTINGLPVSHVQQHHGILWMDFKTANRLVPSLSPFGNLCLNQHTHLSHMGIISRSKRQVIIHEFNLWYGSDDLMKRKNCYCLSKKDTLALMLFRLHLTRPAILFCRDFGEFTEASFSELILRELQDMADQGTAICLFVSDTRHNADPSYFLMRNPHPRR